MTERSLREKVGIFILLVHFGMIIFLTYLWGSGGFTFEEYTTTFAILIPLLAGYVATIVSYFSKRRFSSIDKSKTVTKIFAALSLGFPLALATSISFFMFAFANHLMFSEFEQFKGVFVATESVFAVYVATTTNTLFKVSSTK